MRLNIACLAVALLASESTAFTTPTRAFGRVQVARTTPLFAPLYMTQHTPEEQQKEDDEIGRLRSMAQKLRAEAAALEADRQNEMAQAAENAFRKFDTNQDGEISFEELKAGLEKALKIELPEMRVKQLLDDFDTSGDGSLQINEFVSVEKFRNKLEALAQEEKRLSSEATKSAQKEAEMAKLAEARMGMLNDKEPSTTDKIVSVLPYLFPLMDSLQFGRFLLTENADNPFVMILALLYTLYKAVPFSGFVSFLALNVLSSNPGLNRLVRFNMQQAIFVDIALFFPGLLAALFGLIGSGAGFQVPPGLAELGSDVIFGAMLLTIGYASVSSLLGITPNKIPLISQAVDDRMPTIDMFDNSGQFIPRNEREDKDKKDDKKDD
jgi:hypothetical protein